MSQFFMINSILRFLVETSSILILIFTGLSKFKMPLNLLIGIGMPILFIVVWSIFGAPTSPKRVSLTLRIFIELVIFLTTTLV
ncbi:YrdB family protein, partial [Bombilactobacillus bombi]|uniref:YrdB family protein n=1 Tax=Bombilactobacillus bombi TaxID=1303590 RepID=UPI0015E6111C|nr:DUF2568 domain-containing protein [Bombilactobacillus bombi]